jgi:hypothetical protein
MVDTVPTEKPDVPHPPWCRVDGCDAAASHSHTSPETTIRTSATTRLEVFMEGGTAKTSNPVLLIESYSCNCRSCEPHQLLMLDLADAAAVHEAMGRLLAAAGAP